MVKYFLFSVNTIANPSKLCYTLIKDKKALENEMADFYFLGNSSYSQMFGAIIKTENKTIVIDGGTVNDCDQLLNTLSELSSLHVDAWFFTHPHHDHIGAFVTARQKEKRLTVDKIYYRFLDLDTEDITKDPTDDFLFMVLDRELVYAPGEQRVYSDAAFYLISRVVTKITGERLDDFLMDRLFSKIDCREVAWSKCPRKYPVGATGLYIRSDDMVKLGRIYLDGGVWKGERIVSEEWISIVLERGYELRKFGKGFSKGGMRGQRLYVNFDENIAVAWHSFDPEGKNKLLSEIL